jgi:BCCT family betaine/carnitine transporter
MISQGVSRLTEAQQGLPLEVAVIVIWTALFGLSADLGLQKGMPEAQGLKEYTPGAFALLAGGSTVLASFRVLGPRAFASAKRAED